MVTLLGVDPGLRCTGWGVIVADGSRLRHIADGVIATDSEASVPDRLKVLHDALASLLAAHRPDEAAVEETYVNRNGAATLKLGYARGVALLAPALLGIPVVEYAAKSVKLAVVGTGRGRPRSRCRRWCVGCCRERSCAGLMQPTRWRSPSAMRITGPAASPGRPEGGPGDRQAHRPGRRAGGGGAACWT